MTPMNTATFSMTIKNVIAHLVGLALLVAGFAWLYVDVRPDGHVELTTAAGVAILVSAGGFLVDKAVTVELLGFLKDQGQAVFTLWKAKS